MGRATLSRTHDKPLSSRSLKVEVRVVESRRSTSSSRRSDPNRSARLGAVSGAAIPFFDGRLSDRVETGSETCSSKLVKSQVWRSSRASWPSRDAPRFWAQAPSVEGRRGPDAE